jgi:PAS domain S-box-containing protein
MAPLPPVAAPDWVRTLHDLDVGVVIQDRHARIAFANAKATALLGVTADEMAERTTHDARWDVIYPDGTPLRPEDHPGPRALATGEAQRGVVIGVRRGDAASRVWIMVSAVPQRDANGAVEQVVISFSDVSAAQEALRASEATYDSVFRSMSEGLVIHNADGTIRAANTAAERVLGLTTEQMTGRAATDPSWRLTREDDTPLAPGDIPSEAARLTGKPAGPIVLSVHRPDGSRAWLEVRADPLREHGDDTVRGAVATFTDITESRTTQLALESSRLQMQRVLDAVPGIVFQYRHRAEDDSRLIFVAGRIREVLGMMPHEVRENANVLFERLSPPQQALLREAIARVIVTRGTFQHEVCFEHVDGGVRWMRLFGVPDSGADGIFYTGVMLDITAEKQMAEALRTRQRREAMGDMAAGIAHNFNNMLAVVLPNLQMAQEQATGELAELVGDAERAARSAADLVRRMLALGRADAPDVSAHADLVPIVREALHICRQTFDRGITISESIRVPRAMVRALASDLQQVVLNLCLNARDALVGVRHPALTVSLEPHGTHAVLLTVRDTGIGMSEETLGRIGEPFFTTKQPGRGTGLGLASAFHTISEAGGSWSVMSNRGSGTTFSVQLPITDLDEPAGAQTVANALAPLTGTVLIVDDEPMVRTVLARQVARLGMHAVVADGAEAALQLVRDGVPELRAIVLDLSMPGMSGEEALPLLKVLVPTVPVIALSGYVPDDAVLDRASAILAKPLGQHQFDTVLRQVLSHPEG